MKNKSKLSFDLLEQEMEVFSREEQRGILGGYVDSTGYRPDGSTGYVSTGGYTWDGLLNAINSGNFNQIPAGSYIVGDNGELTIYGGELNEVKIVGKRKSDTGLPHFSSYDGLWKNADFDYQNWDWIVETSGGSSNGGSGDNGYTGGSIEWEISDFFRHYNYGNGAPVSLTETGLKLNVIWSDTYFQMMTNVNNQIESYVHDQVAQGSNYPGTFEFSWDFNNSYDFTLEKGLFAIGSATISGHFSGTFTLDNECKINVNGILDLSFHDRFQDPWDLLNVTNGSWDPTGTPYDINDNWQQEILMQNIVP